MAHRNGETQCHDSLPFRIHAHATRRPTQRSAYRYFYDKLQKRPRSQLLRYMWHTEPWDYEIGDRYAMSDSMLELDPRPQPVPPSPALLPSHGTTMVILLDYYLDKKDAYDDQGLPLHFTGNQDAYLTQALRNLQIAKSEKRQLKYWVICPTKQSFAISPHHHNGLGWKTGDKNIAPRFSSTQARAGMSAHRKTNTDGVSTTRTRAP